MKSRRRFCGATLALLPTAPAMAQTEAWQPPTLTITRYDEDWTSLADPAKATGHWTEAFKYIPLDQSGQTYLTTGTEFRVRNEKYENNLWGSAAAPDDGYLWLRAMPYADLHTGPARAFVQPLIAYAAGVQPSAGPVDQTRFDILQAFADVEIPISADTSLTLRGGREMLSLGTERLIGTRYGPNVPLAFDGGRIILQSGQLTASAFYVRPVQPGAGTLDDKTSSAKALWGLYGTRQLPFATKAGLDLYYIGYRNSHAVFQQGSGVERRHTFGARFYGSADSWHWNVEAMYQFGHFDGNTISAWSVGSEIGRRFPQAPLSPDLIARFNVVSGDKSATDRRLQTFNALFPKGKYFGELSPVGPYNIINASIGSGFTLGGGWSTSLAAMAYWRQSSGDGIYDIPGNLLRAGSRADGRFIGKEAEATVSWQATQELELSASLSAFKPGDFIRRTGPAKTIRMIGLEANFRY